MSTQYIKISTKFILIFEYYRVDIFNKLHCTNDLRKSATDHL